MECELTILEESVAMLDACDPFPWEDSDPALSLKILDAVEDVSAMLPSFLMEPISFQSSVPDLTVPDGPSLSEPEVMTLPAVQVNDNMLMKRPAKNPSRERLKAELSFLREKVVELGTELLQLRHQHEQEAIAMNPTAAIAPVWRRMAQRQLERRRKAEEENAKLRNTLERNIRVAKSLEQMLKKRTSAAMLDLFEGTSRGYKVRTRHSRGQEQVYVNLWDVKLRFVEKDRMVIVWRGTNSPAEDVTDWRHMHTEETGWLVIKRVPETTAGAGSNTTVIQACVNLYPKWFGLQGFNELVHHMKTGDFAMLVTNSYENDADNVIEAVENALLDELAARRSSTRAFAALM
ncbi:hypothetical protein ATCC90586_008963 [Pythium insidiosum]|nr:hypothetical protein ATCC90586_008963 [Pythium insidiosum]